jgi:hypothetical protein
MIDTGHPLQDSIDSLKALHKEMIKQEHFNIPKFKEVYKSKHHDTYILTICELINIMTNEKMAYGVSKSNANTHYNKDFAKSLAYSYAMRYLFLKLTDGKPVIEDRVNDGKAKT